MSFASCGPGFGSRAWAHPPRVRRRGASHRGRPFDGRGERSGFLGSRAPPGGSSASSTSRAWSGVSRPGPRSWGEPRPFPHAPRGPQEGGAGRGPQRASGWAVSAHTLPFFSGVGGVDRNRWVRVKVKKVADGPPAPSTLFLPSLVFPSRLKTLPGYLLQPPRSQQHQCLGPLSPQGQFAPRVPEGSAP